MQINSQSTIKLQVFGEKKKLLPGHLSASLKVLFCNKTDAIAVSFSCYSSWKVVSMLCDII